jgi:peptidyl-prolyl cis-trans isomerase D
MIPQVFQLDQKHMLEALRKSSGGIIAKVFIGLLVLSFAIWGIGDIFRGVSARDVAEVGSIKIDTETFRQAYQERLQQISRQIGRGITPDQARGMGIDRQLLGEMISESTLDAKARELGLNVNDETMLARIHANPAFRGVSGNFDPGRFYETLRSAGFTEQRYVESERRLMLRQQMGRALGADTTAPKVLRDALRRYQNEERSVQFVELTRDQATDVPAPSPSEIETYFNERKTAFRAPEYRKLVILALTAETLADEIKIPDDELKKTYEGLRDRLGQPERRQVEQIIVIDQAEAKSVSDRIASGAKFEDIVAERNLKPGDVELGLVAKREILDQKVADAVFALPQDEISKPIPGRFGTVIARVTKIEPGKQPSFDDVADTLRKDLAIQRARNTILDRHDKIEDERAAGAHLTEVAAKIGTKAITIDAVDRSGRGPDGKVIESVPGMSSVLPEAFAATVGVETDPIEVDNGSGFIWFEVAEVTPSRDRTLDEVRDRVVERWRDDEIAKRLAERADTIRAKLDAGEKFETAAPALTVQTRDKIKRGATVDGLDRTMLAAILETAQGKTGVTAAPDNVGRTVYRVTAVEIPADAAAEPQRLAELNIGVQDDILVQYVLQLQSRMGVRVNQEALRTVTGGSDGN